MSGKVYSEKFKRQVERFYVEDCRSAEDISDDYGNKPSARQIQRWVNEGNWNQKRDELRMTRESIEQKASRAIEKMTKKMLDTEDPEKLLSYSDAIAKLNKTRREYQKQMQVDEAFVILQPIIRQFNEQYPKKDEIQPLFKGSECYWAKLANYIWRNYRE